MWRRNPDHWACRFGITIPTQWLRSGRRLVSEYGVDIVDINFGCPVHQVTEKAHSGSYLLREPGRVGAIVERVVRAVIRSR